VKEPVLGFFYDFSMNNDPFENYRTTDKTSDSALTIGIIAVVIVLIIMVVKMSSGEGLSGGWHPPAELEEAPYTNYGR